MDEYPKLDDGAFAGRLRKPAAQPAYQRRMTPRPIKRVADIHSLNPSSKTSLEPNPQPLSTRNSSLRTMTPPDDQPFSIQPATRSFIEEHANRSTQQGSSKYKYVQKFRLKSFYILAAVIVAIGAYEGLAGLRAHTAVQADNRQSADAISASSQAPDEPRSVDIPFVNIQAPIQKVGLTNGSLETPDNMNDAAWYKGSAKPGQSGVMLIEGHTLSSATRGVFYDIDKLRIGDLIQIQRGDGKTFNYRVVKTKIYDAKSVDMPGLMISADTAKPGLNLISCSGDVIPGTNEFDKRLVVYSVLE